MNCKKPKKSKLARVEVLAKPDNIFEGKLGGFHSSTHPTRLSPHMLELDSDRID